MKRAKEWDMLIDLIGGPMDGETIPWEYGPLHPGMVINVYNLSHPVYIMPNPEPAKDVPLVLQYRIEKFTRHAAFAKHIP